MSTNAGTTDKLPHIRFERTTGEEAFALWHDIGQPGFQLDSAPDTQKSRASFFAMAEFYELDGVIFCHTDAAPAAYTRDQQRAKSGSADYITLHLPLAGGVERGVTADRPFQMATDRICLRDWAHPFETVSQQVEQLAVMIPRERIVERDFLHERQPVISWHLCKPQGRILSSAVHALWKSLPTANGSDAPTLAAGLLGLLNGLIAPDARPQLTNQPSQSLLIAMQRFIDERLSNPLMGVDDLMNAFHCSRATVYRAFREIGGVKAYIRTQRLTRCFRDLRRPIASPPRIYEVAQRWGFTDISYFNRLFKKQFGMAPSDAVFTQRVDGVLISENASCIDEDVAVLHQWITHQ